MHVRGRGGCASCSGGTDCDLDESSACGWSADHSSRLRSHTCGMRDMRLRRGSRQHQHGHCVIGLALCEKRRRHSLKDIWFEGHAGGDSLAERGEGEIWRTESEPANREDEQAGWRRHFGVESLGEEPREKVQFYPLHISRHATRGAAKRGRLREEHLPAAPALERLQHRIPMPSADQRHEQGGMRSRLGHSILMRHILVMRIQQQLCLVWRADLQAKRKQ
mmetsp:Transcript_37669/g.121055  ORF Transcript_37669/g.121055 Transcript_37669/m.121055 type:complete len:221 (-) Transcript_37669:287-949(-)